MLFQGFNVIFRYSRFVLFQNDYKRPARRRTAVRPVITGFLRFWSVVDYKRTGRGDVGCGVLPGHTHGILPKLRFSAIFNLADIYKKWGKYT